MGMEQKKPLISVIMPVYNVEKYIGKCLDSILAQTYPNIEIILVDDASTDNSGRICDEYAARDFRIQAVHFPENRGPSAARNEGVCRGKGEFISFVDSDDTVEPDLLEKLFQSLKENGADMSACGADGIRLKSGPAAVFSQKEAMCCLARGIPFNHVPWGKLYSAGLLTQHPFQEDIFYSEDLLFLYEILASARRVSYLPDILYHYTHREGSQVQSGVDKRKLTALSAQDFVCEDASARFPEAREDFRQLALEVDRCLAVLAVKNGCQGGNTFQYLKILRANIRRHFSWKALALCPDKKAGVSILILYVSAAAFWGIAAISICLKEGVQKWSRINRKSA